MLPQVIIISTIIGLIHCYEGSISKQQLKERFGCPICVPANCPMPMGCDSYVREPGVCGCCYTCARTEGERCGVYTERCENGLQCLPMWNDPAPLFALLQGRGECRRRTDKPWNSNYIGKSSKYGPKYGRSRGFPLRKPGPAYDDPWG